MTDEYIISNINQTYLFHVCITHGFSHTLPLIITSPRADRVHVTPVVFILRMHLWIYIRAYAQGKLVTYTLTC